MNEALLEQVEPVLDESSNEARLSNARSAKQTDLPPKPHDLVLRQVCGAEQRQFALACF